MFNEYNSGKTSRSKSHYARDFSLLFAILSRMSSIPHSNKCGMLPISTNIIRTAET